MVIFICIRCCGIHRSFGTHISKPRSVDLDIWSEESISAAKEWGNLKSNEIWEARIRVSEKPTKDESVHTFLSKRPPHTQEARHETRLTRLEMSPYISRKSMFLESI